MGIGGKGRRQYIWKPKKVSSAYKKMWIDFFRKYVIRKKDLDTLWQLISLKMFNLLLKNGYVVIPEIGKIEVIVKRQKRIAMMSNGSPVFLYPKSKLIFTPSVTLKNIFDNKCFTTHELLELEEGNFDWIKKSASNIRYERVYK